MVEPRVAAAALAKLSAVYKGLAEKRKAQRKQRRVTMVQRNENTNKECRIRRTTVVTLAEERDVPLVCEDKHRRMG